MNMYGGAFNVAVIVVGNRIADPISNTACVSLDTATFWKGMNPLLFPSVMGKQNVLLFFSPDKVISLRDELLRI